MCHFVFLAARFIASNKKMWHQEVAALAWVTGKLHRHVSARHTQTCFLFPFSCLMSKSFFETSCSRTRILFLGRAYVELSRDLSHAHARANARSVQLPCLLSSACITETITDTLTLTFGVYSHSCRQETVNKLRRVCGLFRAKLRDLP